MNKYNLNLTPLSNICKALVEHPHSDSNISCNMIQVFLVHVKVTLLHQTILYIINKNNNTRNVT